MRGLDTRQEGMFSYVSPESRIPKIICCDPSGRWSMTR